MPLQQTPPTEHTLTLRKPYFDLIADGTKTVEVRVGYPKVQRMVAGDLLRFTCQDASLTTRIIGVRQYKSFVTMLDAEDASAIGGPELNREQLLAVIRDIYPAEKEALGVFALHLARLSE
ncbi:ASCH domain-containing protein [Streptomyces sp. 71268]|uniref:ASCH domain-containing protein n=1 Tax=Streptomyces sp. 71268 TaxID=3002640 RepID=UPI0023F88573|nr:ASCH domain-containing protein [Streptomyces sp. 71268]WEV26434.1 ASCH domain-containing protein [Streptomyces sp. 71268]